MTRVFIATRVMDEHAISVDIALSKKGHEAYRWHGADFPSLQMLSCSIENDVPLRTSIVGPDIQVFEFDFSTIWYRRPARPVVPTIWLHADDVPAASKESELFWLSFPHLFSGNATWVNHWESRSRINNKIVQLREAKRLGFRIPKSLFGNNPDEIKQFIRSAPDGAIYKTFFPMRWIDGTSIAKITTTPVDLNSLPSDKTLRSVPGIFQERIRKQFEIRATFMGDTSFIMRIDSQNDPLGIEDFRRIPTNDLLAKPYQLPSEIVKKCQKLMRHFDILFCSFDFIVDVDGNHVFLEVNEQGQFLWLEQLCPELPMLDAFTDFLVNPSRNFQYIKKVGALRVGDIYRQAKFNELYERDQQVHVFSPDPALAEPKNRFGVQVTI